MLKIPAEGLSTKHMVVTGLFYIPNITAGTRWRSRRQGRWRQARSRGEYRPCSCKSSLGKRFGGILWWGAAEPGAGAVSHPGDGHKASSVSPSAGPCLPGPALQWLCN